MRASEVTLESGINFSCTELVNSINNLLSYFGLVDAKISDSDKYLPTHTIYSTFYSRD